MHKPTVDPTTTVDPGTTPVEPGTIVDPAPAATVNPTATDPEKRKSSQLINNDDFTNAHDRSAIIDDAKLALEALFLREGGELKEGVVHRVAHDLYIDITFYIRLLTNQEVQNLTMVTQQVTQTVKQILTNNPNHFDKNTITQIRTELKKIDTTIKNCSFLQNKAISPEVKEKIQLHLWLFHDYAYQQYSLLISSLKQTAPEEQMAALNDLLDVHIEAFPELDSESSDRLDQTLHVFAEGNLISENVKKCLMFCKTLFTRQQLRELLEVALQNNKDLNNDANNIDFIYAYLKPHAAKQIQIISKLLDIQNPEQLLLEITELSKMNGEEWDSIFKIMLLSAKELDQTKIVQLVTNIKIIYQVLNLKPCFDDYDNGGNDERLAREKSGITSLSRTLTPLYETSIKLLKAINEPNKNIWDFDEKELDEAIESFKAQELHPEAITEKQQTSIRDVFNTTLVQQDCKNLTECLIRLGQGKKHLIPDFELFLYFYQHIIPANAQNTLITELNEAIQGVQHLCNEEEREQKKKRSPKFSHNNLLITLNYLFKIQHVKLKPETRLGIDQCYTNLCNHFGIDDNKKQQLELQADAKLVADILFYLGKGNISPQNMDPSYYFGLFSEKNQYIVCKKLQEKIDESLVKEENIDGFLVILLVSLLRLHETTKDEETKQNILNCYNFFSVKSNINQNQPIQKFLQDTALLLNKIEDDEDTEEPTNILHSAAKKAVLDLAITVLNGDKISDKQRKNFTNIMNRIEGHPSLGKKVGGLMIAFLGSALTLSFLAVTAFAIAALILDPSSFLIPTITLVAGAVGATGSGFGVAAGIKFFRDGCARDKLSFDMSQLFHTARTKALSLPPDDAVPDAPPEQPQQQPIQVAPNPPEQPPAQPVPNPLIPDPNTVPPQDIPVDNGGNTTTAEPPVGNNTATGTPPDSTWTGWGSQF